MNNSFILMKILIYFLALQSFCVRAQVCANQFEVPILLIIFNRPEIQQHVFNKIREIKPKQLFIAADGPREQVASDQEKCARARKIIEQIDWPCDVHTLFQENNLGAPPAVIAAIHWFFGCVEEGIVLEDDCVPSTSFFSFCQKMLQKYREDDRVWNVLGTNYFGQDESYFFGRWFVPTGWASWQRAWKHYHYDNLETLTASDWLRFFFNKKEAQIWLKFFYHAKTCIQQAPIMHEWDTIWSTICITNGGLSIYPPVNMVSHSLGYGPESTHWKDYDPHDKRCVLKAYDCDIATMKCPEDIRVKQEFMPDFRAPLDCVVAQKKELPKKKFKKVFCTVK